MKCGGIQSPESIFGVFCFLKKGEIVVICVSICAFICVCVCMCVCLVLMKLGMNCVMLCPVGHGVATFNLEYKIMNGVIDLTLVNDQLDTQFFYFIIRLLQSSTWFEQCRAHHQEVKLY